MKTKIMISIALLFLITFSSCSKKDDNNNTMSSEEASASAKIDSGTDDVSAIVDEQFQATLQNPSNRNNIPTMITPACATITRTPAFGTQISAGTLVTKTIDFGTSGCPMSNGNVLKGKIIITFVYQPTATSNTITYTFNGFVDNNVAYNGTKTFTRSMTTATPNSPSHPIVVMLVDVSATVNTIVYTRTGTRTREIIAGYSTPNLLSDDVYQITGNWDTTFPSGIRHSEITSPIIMKLNCNYFVQGIISFVQNSSNASLDYGNGACDDQAVFTINGNSYNITL